VKKKASRKERKVFSQRKKQKYLKIISESLIDAWIYIKSVRKSCIKFNIFYHKLLNIKLLLVIQQTQITFGVKIPN